MAAEVAAVCDWSSGVVVVGVCWFLCGCVCCVCFLMPSSSIYINEPVLRG
jgi:hypothetical protein